MQHDVVTAAHPASQSATPTRNVDAERGVGRAERHDANMLPRVPVRVSTQRPGMSAIRSWNQSRAWEERKGVVGKTGAMHVAVRSGNIDPQAVGLNKTNWGIAGEGDSAAAPSTAPRNLLILGGLAVLAACFLFKKD